MNSQPLRNTRKLSIHLADCAPCLNRFHLGELRNVVCHDLCELSEYRGAYFGWCPRPRSCLERIVRVGDRSPNVIRRRCLYSNPNLSRRAAHNIHIAYFAISSPVAGFLTDILYDANIQRKFTDQPNVDTYSSLPSLKGGSVFPCCVCTAYGPYRALKRVLLIGSLSDGEQLEIIEARGRSTHASSSNAHCEAVSHLCTSVLVL